MSKLYMMAAITNRSMKHKFREFYKENGHMVVFETLGRGTATVPFWTILAWRRPRK